METGNICFKLSSSSPLPLSSPFSPLPLSVLSPLPLFLSFFCPFLLFAALLFFSLVLLFLSLERQHKSSWDRAVGVRVFRSVFPLRCVLVLCFLCIRGRCFQYCACDVSTAVLLFWTIVFACCALVRRYGAFCVLCFSQSFVLDSAFVSDSAFVCVSVIRSQQWLVVHFKNLTHRLTMNGSSGLTRVVSRSSEHGKNDMSECFFRGRSCNVLS